MKNNSILLLKTLLLSTSQRNIYKHTTDQKKKRRIVGNTIGVMILYAMIMGYCISMCIGYGTYGLIDAAPVMSALLISALAFIFTFLKTNGYLFHFREYDMLMSLPFEVKSVCACKFLYMYVNSLPWYLSISVSMMAAYGYYVHPAVFVYPVWLILSLFLPLIPMLLAAFLGFLIARISAGFKKKNLIQTIFTFIFILFFFFIRFIIEDVFKNDQVKTTLDITARMTEQTAGIYLPAKWFSDVIIKHQISSGLLLTGVSLLLFSVVFAVVGNSYRNINSALKSHAAAKNFKMTAQKKHSIVWAIAYKEFKRMTGSTTYMTNAALGEVMVTILGIIMLIIGFDRIVALVTNHAPFNPAILHPAIPFIIYFFIGMIATTACSPSLEGKNYWIVQSLPIEKKTLYQGKMLFNMCLTVPFTMFSTLCMCISAKVPLPDTILYLILGFALCAFSTAWGCVCGVKHMRLDWENEVEVIKQGTAVTIYLLPNMFIVMGLCVLVVVFGMHMDHKLVALIFILIATVLAALSYRRVMTLSGRD